MELVYIIVVLVYFKSTSGFARTLLRTEYNIAVSKIKLQNVVRNKKVVEVVEVGAFKGTLKIGITIGKTNFKKPYAGPLLGHALLEWL